MKIKKIILPLLLITALLASCDNSKPENLAYNMLCDDIENISSEFTQYTSDIENNINSESDPYELLNTAYDNQDQLISKIANAETELANLKETISEEQYVESKEKIDNLYEQIELGHKDAEDYLIIKVKSQLEALLTEYENAEDTSTVDIQAAQELADQLNALSETDVFQNDELKAQSTVLAAFISCRDSYDNWIIASKEFAKKSVSSPDKSSSQLLTRDYLLVTNEYFESHKQALTTVQELSMVDAASDENAIKLLEIFDKYTKQYEDTALHLNYVLTLR